MKPTFPTRVALEETTRRELNGRLNILLATTTDLYTQIKQAHWNIKGPHFFARHQLFDEVAAHARIWADTIAERVSTLGGYACGTVKDASEQSLLESYDVAAVQGIAHVRVVVERLAHFCKLTREMAAMSERMKEPVTQDLCIEILRQAEQDMWFLESHLYA